MHAKPETSPAIARTLVFVTLVSCPAAVFAQSSEPAAFVLNNVSDEISTYTMAPDGTMTFLGNTPTSDGPIAGALTPDGRFLAVAHGTASETVEVVQVFEVGTGASLALLVEDLVPDSPLAATWLTDRVLALTHTDLSGPNSIDTYLLDPDAATLTPVDSGPTGSFTHALALHPTLPVIYAQDSSANKITWYSYDAAGVLTLEGSVFTSLYPLRMTVTNDGQSLYSACGISGDSHRVLGYAIGTGGALTALGGSPFYSPGDSPAYLDASGDDTIVFVGHGRDATVRSFTRDDESGALFSTGFMFDVGLQGTIGDVQVLGDYLLVTDESTAIDGIAGLYSFAIHPDGSFTAVDDIYFAEGVRPETIVTWDPVGAFVPGDVTGDGVVNVEDLLLVLSEWGAAGGPGDANGDGIVDVGDLLIVLGNWT